LLKIVNDAYPDGKVADAAKADYYDKNSSEDSSTVLNIGDTLAVFLYYELVHDGGPDAAGDGTAEGQLEELMGRCEMAIRELDGVRSALQTKKWEIENGKNKK